MEKNKLKDLLEIFTVFMRVGALTFGGGYAMLPILQKEITDKRKWIAYEEITDYYAISQCLPGIIAINTAMLIGSNRRGKPGMIAAALGVAFPSVLVIVVIAAFIESFMSYELVRNAFNGVRVAVCALVVNAVIRLFKSGVRDVYGIIIFAFVLVFTLFVDISPIIPVAVSAALGVLIKNKAEGKQ